MSDYIFTSEAVSPGHPDKTCDQISDALLDCCLTSDPFARCAFEAFVTKNNVIIGGETRIKNYNLTTDIVDGIIRNVLQNIGHDFAGFSYKDVKITNLIHSQSPDISIGVDESQTHEEGAGDQGIMFGYACKETPDFMPSTIYYAHKILENIWNEKPYGLGPDAKSQVSLKYIDGKPVAADSVTVSIQHLEEISLEDVKKAIIPIIERTLPAQWMPTKERIFINPTGRFVIGGPVSDTGLTGRKIIVDTYGGAAPHGGGAFSGKDPTKVDRSAAYIARFIAKNIVSAGLASRCTIQLSYVIGISKPISVYINTHGTCTTDEQKLVQFILNNVPLTPKGIREFLGLNKAIYLPTATFGHFGRKAMQNGEFSWEDIAKYRDLFVNL